MWNCTNPRLEVEGDGAERGTLKWVLKTSRAVLLDELEDSGAECPELDRVLLEGAYKSIVSSGQGKRPMSHMELTDHCFSHFSPLFLIKFSSLVI